MENNTILTALLSFQKECRAIMYDKTNPFFKGSKYASLQTIIHKISPLLYKNNLILTQSIDEYTLVTNLYHVETGEVLSSKHPLVMEKNTMQSLGSAVTYARRYSICTLLNIVADNDDDGNYATFGEESPKEKIEAIENINIRPKSKEGEFKAGNLTAKPSEVQSVASLLSAEEMSVFDDKKTIQTQKGEIKYAALTKGIDLKEMPKMIHNFVGRKATFEELSQEERDAFVEHVKAM